MRICIAIEKFDPSVGGAERYCWDLAHFLVEQGHEVAIICMKAGGSPEPSISILRLPVLKFPQFLRHITFAFSHFLKAREMKEYIHFCVGNTFFMDIYQPHGGVHRAWFIKETAMYKEPTRTFMRIIRRLSLKDIVQRAMEWWIFKITRPRVIAISEMVAEDIRKFFSYPPHRITLIPNGIDLEKYRRENQSWRTAMRGYYGIDAEEFVFMFVAQNPKLKGYDVLINACRELQDIAFRVLIVGPHDRAMEKQAWHMGDKVIFAGRSKELHKIYPSCDCLVHPTFYDACSLVILESLASGVPVITTCSNGAKMYVQGDAGYVISPGDVGELAAAMKKAMGPMSHYTQSVRLKSNRQVFAEVEEVIVHEGE